MKQSLFAFFVFWLFVGCSSNVFKPEAIMGKRSITLQEPKARFAQHDKAVTYDDGTVLTKEGIVDPLVLPQGFAYLNEQGTRKLAANLGGDVLVLDGEHNQTYHFPKRILSVSMHNNLLATVNVDNMLELFDIDANRTLFKHTGSEVLAVDMRLANPYFYDDLIFYPTLDGKVQIFSQAKGELVRTMSISTDEHFNNIIFFTLIDQKIIAATGSALYRFGTDIQKLPLPIRLVRHLEGELLVLSKEGTVYRFDANLQEQKRMKFKFAHLMGIVATSSHYYLPEIEGYLIALAKDFSRYDIFKLDFDTDLFFNGSDRFYFADGYFKP